MHEPPTLDALRRWAEDVIADEGGTLEEMTPLRVEASHRSFYRLVTDGESLVAMTSPPELENNDQFLALARLFARHAIPVPHVTAHDATRGFFLLEDLGPLHFAEIYGTGDEDAALSAAIGNLHALQRIVDPAIPPYTAERFEMELGIFTEWFVGKLLGTGLGERYEGTFAALVAQTQEQPQVAVHRDYHCRNLLFNAGRLGIVDFQDALMGPALYDLASLLHDCYHVFSDAAIDRWLDVYRRASPLDLPGRAATRRWLDLTAVQRQLKAVGIFARLHLRDAKPAHLGYVLPLLDRIAALAGAYPETRALVPELARLTPLARDALSHIE